MHMLIPASLLARVFRQRGCSALRFCSSSRSQDRKKRDEDGRRGLLKEIAGRIRFGGPITVAQYMQEVLANPLSGYYMNENVLGADGDFVTSPEITQMFGECVAAWIAHEWTKVGSPQPFSLVELGPGKGTLMADVLRVFCRLRLPQVEVHLVENSEKMREMQKAKLSATMATIRWHGRLEEVPDGFSFFLANEFFDVLPIHKFVWVDEDNGFREVLIDVNDRDDSLRFVRARHPTPASGLVDARLGAAAIEISPRSGIVMNQLSQRIDEFGGAALIADYGNDGPAADSFRAFKNHRLHVDPLVDPGTADLTADVDFSHLKRNCSEHTLTYGPVSQSDFLKRLGIETRLSMLNNEEAKAAYHMLTDDDKMGKRFKFLSVFPKTMAEIHKRFPPVGFQ